MMELYNTLTKKIEPLDTRDGKIRIYSCGPTVYERAHIGNLASFIYADTLRRAIEASGYEVEHVMNITDVDDKTISNSREQYPDLSPMDALKKLTSHYEQLFMDDLELVGVDVSKIRFVRATDNIESMQELISNLLASGVAYETEDGIYFSIDKYKSRGKKYGQLVDISESSISKSRIDNDEYDKDNPQDFVLWKAKKEGEPSWDFEVNGKNIAGRPGWHIECSAMSVKYLGQPFDIHTGGVDLKFPHHENEIAQSTVLNGDLLAKTFFHSEHILIDNQKMSKSLNNFLTIEDIKEKGFDPLAFRLLVLEGKYSNQRNFSWDILKTSAKRLKEYQIIADRVAGRKIESDLLVSGDFNAFKESLITSLQDDLNTPAAIAELDNIASDIGFSVAQENLNDILELVKLVDDTFALSLSDRADISDHIKELIKQREQVRQNQDWAKSDELRKQLEGQGIGINDTPIGPVWYRL